MQSSVLLCECVHSGLIGRAKLQALRASLESAHVPFTTVADLCALAARKDPLLAELVRGPETRILACYPRAVRALFQFAGAPLAPGDAQLINLREASIEAALSCLGLSASLAAVEEGAPENDAPAQAGNGWIPWFPVIDSERCSRCQQCLGFCLFGVYALAADGRVVVQQPEACKTNCPACARICPQVAIIFPKYEAGVIAGAEVTDEEKEKARVQADLKKILGSNVYQALAERRQKAQQRRLLRPDVDLAKQERQMHLDRLGVPPAPGTVNSPTPAAPNPALPPPSPPP
jgi:NAD-dependent dihydropyrimidine dehydrogenase PreA subunit